jgi:hypothetical protein
MRTSVARAASGAVVTTAAVLALAGPASANPIPPLEHTTLSIVESRTVIRAGHADVVSGRLASGPVSLNGKVVLLERLEGKRFVPVRAGITGRGGHISFRVWPDVKAWYKLVYLGSRNLLPTHSGIVTVKVIP